VTTGSGNGCDAGQSISKAPLIRVEEVSKHYDNGLIKAVNGVSFQMEAGTVYSIMGPSGCGKSTLLNLIGALDIPTAGKILFNNKPLRENKALHVYRSRHVGFVFQLHNLLPALTLLENVELPMYADKTISANQRREKAFNLLEEVQLTHRAHFSPSSVSGGERQRAAVARALANEPDILLADEPTGSVDSKTAKYILEAITGRCKSAGITVLIATHNDQVAGYADRGLHMQDGLLI